MAEAERDIGFDDEHSELGEVLPSFGEATTLRHYVNMVAALTSAALLVGAGVWGYQLAVRDVQGVPVIQALEGPMRISPENPGGEIVDYQGLAVNDVAAEGAATPLPDLLTLAPRPTELTAEDIAGLPGQDGSDAKVAPVVAAVAGDGPVLAAVPPLESVSPTEVAIDAALAEALGEVPVATEAQDIVEVSPVAAPEGTTTAPPEPELAAAEGVATINISPRPKSRPLIDATPDADSSGTKVTEIDPASIPIGTRLVQFGAFDSEDEARAVWGKLEARFGEVMAGKAMVLQSAERGGRTFVRLRAHGFEDEDDARRFCVIFTAEGLVCIPVPQR